ncbi:MAG: tetratricopeptide repeat protein [Planctomycetota bacterium]
MATTFGKYILEEKLGQGGMGEVYLATDTDLGRKVAIKVIISDDKEMLERFQREALAVAKLKHPNIVQVYEAGTVTLPATAGGAARQQHYFTMDYIEGTSLEKIIQSPTQVGITDMTKIILEVALALEYAHNQDLIHRDIKPANILLDKNGKAYVADFGLAKQLTGLNRSLTLTGTTIGTPNYMSPEQAMGQKDQIDRRSDIFSLGATLYHCITGQMPFDGKEIYEVFSKVINNEPLLPSSIINIVPKDLETICLKCLEKDKFKRYQSAQELAIDLKRYLEGEPITARRTSPLSKLWTRAKKNKSASIGIASAAVILLAVIIGLAVSSAKKAFQMDQYRKDARSYFKQDKFEEARVACEKIRAITEKDSATNAIYQKCLTAIDEKNQLEKQQESELAQYRKDAQGYFDQGDFEEARISCEKIRAITKKDAGINAMYEKCLAAIAEEDKREKEQEAENEAKAELRQKAKVVLDRASGSANPDERIQAAMDAINIDPSFGDAYQFIGYACEDKKDYDKAYEYFTKAIEATPELAYSYYERALITAYVRHKPKLAIADFEKVLQYDPSSYMGYYAKGNMEAQQRRFDDAIASYTKAIEIHPNYAWAHRTRGCLYLGKREYAKAIADFDQVLRLEPKDAKAYFVRGYTRYVKKEYEQAIADYSAVINLEPQNTQAYYMRGFIYRIKMDLEPAIADFTELINLSPKNAEAYVQRGTVYMAESEKLSAGQPVPNAFGTNRDQDPLTGTASAELFDKAISDYNQAISLDPKNGNAYYYRGGAYAVKKDYDRTIADYTEAIKLNQITFSMSVIVGGNLSNTPDSKEIDLDEAVNLWANEQLSSMAQTLVENKKYYESFLARGVAYSKKGEFDLAIADYGQLIKVEPKYAVAWYNTACAYSLKGDKSNALTALAKAITLDAKFKEEAKKDEDFKSLWQDADFKKLVE